MSNKKEHIAIIGSTGNVGRKIVEIFIERKNIDPSKLKLFSSSKSAGQLLTVGEYSYRVEDVADYHFDDCFLVLFATDSDISKKYAAKALAQGAKVIDSSSAYRLDPKVPLIVPPINSELITKACELFALANCVACPIAVVLKPLQAYQPIRRVVVSTYQSVSGAGKIAMEELYLQTQGSLADKPLVNTQFARSIAFNVIPQIDKFLENGFTYEESKIIQEVQKLVSAEIKIAATSVRVPVMQGHCSSLAIEFAKPINLEEIKKSLKESHGIQLSPDHYTTPIEVVGKDDVYVGRLRKDPTVENGILLWLASDNLRRGAALDAVELAEKLHQLS